MAQKEDYSNLVCPAVAEPVWAFIRIDQDLVGEARDVERHGRSLAEGGANRSRSDFATTGVGHRVFL
jgi:hypothetical protein